MTRHQQQIGAASQPCSALGFSGWAPLLRHCWALNHVKHRGHASRFSVAQRLIVRAAVSPATKLSILWKSTSTGSRRAIITSLQPSSVSLRHRTDFGVLGKVLPYSSLCIIHKIEEEEMWTIEWSQQHAKCFSGDADAFALKHCGLQRRLRCGTSMYAPYYVISCWHCAPEAPACFLSGIPFVL